MISIHPVAEHVDHPEDPSDGIRALTSPSPNDGPNSPDRHRRDLPLHLKLLDDKLTRPSFAAIFEIINNTPRLRSIRRELYKRREDLLNESFDEDSQRSLASHPYRRVQSFLINLCIAARDRSLRPMLEHAIDYEATRESNYLKGILFGSKQHHIPLAITGAGLHGAIFNSAFTGLDPSTQAITFEKRDHLGGQFRSYGGAVIRLNSATG
ncbi:MAG: hypothetical protein KDD53_10605, partial [Bdellovibrionales bacterium]|nr:hypothetical protein [Bdellovibrionales bacterium]